MLIKVRQQREISFEDDIKQKQKAFLEPNDYYSLGDEITKSSKYRNVSLCLGRWKPQIFRMRNFQKMTMEGDSFWVAGHFASLTAPKLVCVYGLIHLSKDSVHNFHQIWKVSMIPLWLGTNNQSFHFIDAVTDPQKITPMHKAKNLINEQAKTRTWNWVSWFFPSQSAVESCLYLFSIRASFSSTSQHQCVLAAQSQP